jgi:hypothetical protein
MSNGRQPTPAPAHPILQIILQELEAFAKSPAGQAIIAALIQALLGKLAQEPTLRAQTVNAIDGYRRRHQL